MPRVRTKPVVSPNMGLYLDRPSIVVPARAIIDGLNFRVKYGTLQSLNLGWTPFSEAWQLDGPVELIDNFFPRGLDEKLIFGTARNLYLYDPEHDTISFLNPIYATGTAAATGTAVTGAGTTWLTNAVAGDQISFGSAAVNDPAATWYTIASVGTNTGIVLEGTGVPVPVTDGPYTLRRVFAMSNAGWWDMDVFVDDADSGDDLWIATNGADPVISWNGTDPTVTMHPELGFVCRTLTVQFNMVIYGNLTLGATIKPASIINSDVGKPLLAGDVGAGLSEEFRVHDGQDGIINLVPLGDTLVIYSDRHITTAQFAGDDLVFVFRNAIAGIGPVSNNAIADFGDFHEFIASDAQYTFDGVTLQETNAHVFREVLRTADPMRRHRVYGHFDEEQGDLIWSVPATTDAGAGTLTAPPSVAWTEHYLEDAGEDVETPFSRRTFPFTYTGFYQQFEGQKWSDMGMPWQEVNYAWNDQFFQSGFPLNLGGDSAGRIWFLNTSQAANGAPLPSFVRFGRLPLGTGRESSLLQRIYAFLRAAPHPIRVIARLADSASGPIARIADVEMPQTMGEEQHFVSIFRRGRFMELELNAPDGAGWVLEGYDYDVKLGGTR